MKYQNVLVRILTREGRYRTLCKRVLGVVHVGIEIDYTNDALHDILGYRNDGCIIILGCLFE